MALYQDTLLDKIEAAEHVLAHYREPGYPRGGSFTTKLIELWEAADRGNQAALDRAFPAMGYATHAMQNGGTAELSDRLAEYRAALTR